MPARCESETTVKGGCPAMSPVNDGVPVRVKDAKKVVACDTGCSARVEHFDDIGDSSAVDVANTFGLNLSPFDTGYYQDLIRARAATIRRVVRALKPALGLRNALDVGCGVGFFAQTLTELGLETRGFDGRFENVVEARRRYPRLAFEYGDIESAETAELGTFD